MQKTITLVVSLLLAVAGFAGNISPDSTRQAMAAFMQKKEQVRHSGNATEQLAFGCWAEARQNIFKTPSSTAAGRLLRADWYLLQNDFAAAEKEVNAVLKQSPANVEALLKKSFLEIQAWRLSMAVSYADKALLVQPASAAALLQKGRALLLQKRYGEALALAQGVVKTDPANAKAYLLEADVYFWNQHPEKAEAPLKKSLELDPFNADARFSYGYAIWRRIDARQLPAMAAQWELALAINPLHYQTHWHWGNGHTNLTYADYAEADDDTVRNMLKPADSLFKTGSIAAALQLTRDAEKKYPGSVIPLLHRASLYYSAFDMDRRLRLDSAQALFEKILTRKKHFGAAHNGLSAVIKSKRIPYLDAYDSIEHALSSTPITDREHFIEVFNDLDFFPGNRAAAMVWNQLYSAVVYFPFLAKQKDGFKVPPLHIDLATAFQMPFFRTATTFDNRQWMDIRGVGSGAAAIEYVERGAYLERNVVLHEYVHEFHGDVFTDAENRAVRKHYYRAMAEGRTLDYYSQNNEHEYLAQTYPAYFEPVKVHPLDFKSMNTTADLKSRDPGMYAFLDSLVKKEKAYLAGDAKAMASNWAQVYINMSQQVRNEDPAKAGLLLDTALHFDGAYLPAFIAKGVLAAQMRDTVAARQWIEKGISISANYAPLYAAYSGLFSGWEVPEKHLQKAISIEDDFLEQAALYRQLAELYRRYGKIPEAIATADAYAKNGATVSTYLRDRRDDAAAYAAHAKAVLGYPEPLESLNELVARKPQNNELRLLQIEALTANRRYAEAIASSAYARRIQQSAGIPTPELDLLQAQALLLTGQKDSATRMLLPLANAKWQNREYELLLVRLLILAGEKQAADKKWAGLPATGTAFYASGYLHTLALATYSDQPMKQQQILREALLANPYNYEAAASLMEILRKSNDENGIKILKYGFSRQPLPPGPAYAW